MGPGRQLRVSLQSKQLRTVKIDIFLQAGPLSSGKHAATLKTNPKSSASHAYLAIRRSKRRGTVCVACTPSSRFSSMRRLLGTVKCVECAFPHLSYRAEQLGLPEFIEGTRCSLPVGSALLTCFVSFGKLYRNS